MVVGYVVRPNTAVTIGQEEEDRAPDSQVVGTGLQLGDNKDSSYALLAHGPNITDVAEYSYQPLHAEVDTETVTELRYVVRFEVLPGAADIVQIFNNMGLCPFYTNSTADGGTHTAESWLASGYVAHPQPTQGQIITHTTVFMTKEVSGALIKIYADYFKSNPDLFQLHTKATFVDDSNTNYIRIYDECMVFMADPYAGYDAATTGYATLDGSGALSSSGGDTGGGNAGGGNTGGSPSHATPTWWDGTKEVATTAVGAPVTWFDGSTEKNITFDGWWDGTTVKPLAP